MGDDRRRYPRFEPAFFDVEIKSPNNYEVRGRILDSSRCGLAAALPEDVELPAVNSKVNLTAITVPPDGSKVVIGAATVLRSWSEEGVFDNGQGIALNFESLLDENNTNRRLLRGIQQKTRLESQAKLVGSDLNYLGAYRRDLISCQMKLFALILTVGVALAGAYFALTYHSIATHQLSNPNLSFWRTMVAALPGCLSIACALMVAQKSISIQRLDSYLLVLKECLIRGQYPREYKGWETDYRKFRHILNTEACQACESKRKCGNLKNEDQEQLKKRKMFRSPQIDLYHIVMYMSFFSAFGLSTIAVLIELTKFQWGIPLFMAIASGITFLFFVAVLGLFNVFFHLRKGKFSINYYKRCWIDILNRCRQPI